MSKETKSDPKKRYFLNFRSSCSEVCCKIGVLKNFAKLTGKRLCWSLLKKHLRPEGCNFNKKRLQHRCFSVNFAKFLRPNQAPTYKRQGRATIARLITKFRCYRCAKSRSPPTKLARGGVRRLFLLEHYSFLSFRMRCTNYN